MSTTVAVAAPAAPVSFRTARRELLTEFERVYLLSLLERHGSDLKSAAREAELPLRSFLALVRKHTRPYVLARVRAFYGASLPPANARRIADQLLQLELTA